MKNYLLSLLSLIFSISSFAQDLVFVPVNFNVSAEIQRAGKMTISRYQNLGTRSKQYKADTCLSRSEILQAKVYVEWLEGSLKKSQTNEALLRFQATQHEQSIKSLQNQKETITTNLNECSEEKEKKGLLGKIGTGLGIGLGVVLGILIAR